MISCSSAANLDIIRYYAPSAVKNHISIKFKISFSAAQTDKKTPNYLFMLLQQLILLLTYTRLCNYFLWGPRESWILNLLSSFSSIIYYYFLYWDEQIIEIKGLLSLSFIYALWGEQGADFCGSFSYLAVLIMIWRFVSERLIESRQ